MKRFQIQAIKKDLEKKMVFLVGPRQVGKTWLSKEIARSFKSPVYLNYDRIEDRKIIHSESWLESTDFLVLDELHKMPNFKNYLKGVYDTKQNSLKILVTGSARLDTFRRSGDSLAGRFFIHHLLPFSLAELEITKQELDIKYFLKRGGFPESLFATTDIEAKRWQNQYIDGLIRNDILDFERITDLRSIELVFELLRSRVGSPISYTSIAEDVGISPNTVKKYIQILESLFIIFRVSPHSKNIARSILKESKIYFYDNSLVKNDKGACLENFVAVSLLKHVYAKKDYLAEDISLNYLRTKEGKEVDFCLVSNGDVDTLLEVKYSNDSLSKSLLYFKQKYSLNALQLVQDLKRERLAEGVSIVKLESFLKDLYL